MRGFNKILFFFVLLLFCLSISCKNEDDSVSSSTPTPKHIISGQWYGSSQGLSIDLTINHLSGYYVSGVGTLVYDEKNLTATASGVFIDSNLTLNIANGNYEAVKYTAKMVDSSKFSGRIKGSGFDNILFFFIKK